MEIATNVVIVAGEAEVTIEVAGELASRSVGIVVVASADSGGAVG